MQLKDEQDRRKLEEGRSYGLGFAFCKRSGDTVETIQPISPCKDYLNDVVYTEATGKPFYAFGLNTAKTGCFDDGKAYLVMGILPYQKGGNMTNHDKLVATLDSITPIASFLSHFERGMGVDVSRWEKIASNRILATLPRFWVEATYRISLWTLLARVGLQYKGGDPMEFLSAYDGDDTYLLKKATPKIKAMLGGTIPIQNFNVPFSVHNTGIVGYPFK